MNIFQGLIYGAISGVSHFLPVPAVANQTVLLKLFGASQRDHLCDAIVHICILLSLLVSAKGLFDQMQYDPRRRSSHHTKNTYISATRRFYKNSSYCCIPVLIALLLSLRLEVNYLLVSFFLTLNGFLLFIPCRMYQGNKDIRSVSRLDSFLFGVANALSAVPGFSGIGCSISVAVMRGVDRNCVVNWILLLSLPTLVVLSGSDIIFLITNWNTIVFGSVFSYLFAGVFAFVGGLCSISLLRLIARKAGFHDFAFYSWGLALLMLILFLI